MNKHYAVTDIHGMYNLWAQIRDYCDETDTIYFLGDACDRGKDGLKIITELLQDPRVIYLKGNHEDIFSFVGEELKEDIYDNISWWYQNGGLATMEDFQCLDLASKEWYLKKLRELEETAIYVNKKGQNIFLSHAGTSIERTKRELQLMGRGNAPYLWDREHFLHPWPQDEQYDNWYVVHGHSPVIYVQHRKGMKLTNEILEYDGGHKFDLDLGSFDTYKIALFDLDELKVEKYFYDLTILEEKEE